MSWPSQLSAPQHRSPPRQVAAATVLLLPAMLVLAASANRTGTPRAIDVGIAVFLTLEAMFLVNKFGFHRAANSWFLGAFYVVAFADLRFNAPDLTSPLTHASLAVAMVVPIAIVIKRELGAALSGNVRQAKLHIRKLLTMKGWPPQFSDYRNLAVVQDLRTLVRDNPAPVLPLLAHPDVRVQVAALTALECQPVWRRGQAEAVIHRANLTEEPVVRAAALAALANVYKPRHLVAMLPFLRDRVAEVRRAAALAILWDARRRWPEVRGAVRLALAEAHAETDGPLPCSAHLPPAALDDLVAWSCETGAIGRRSTQTLLRHCKKAIKEDGSPEAIARVVGLVLNGKVPPGLRVELAHRLKQADEFPDGIGGRLLAPTEPTMLRLMAAATFLARGPDPRAVAVLKEAAKQPNRQIALTAAGMIQKYLGVDMGLPVGGELPAPNSRQAAEVARKVIRWAADPSSHEEPTVRELTPVESDVAHF
ncbi:MAG TPA: HEAT repeat domain-containing protein [Gemmataceae bacterium]|nr:HEAT repeat domain-containing protein [Gemmataceae bacterium]